MNDTTEKPDEVGAADTPAARTPDAADSPDAKRKRPDPTRYGDWEKDGRCIDF